jgi:hypothetical protein
LSARKSPGTRWIAYTRRYPVSNKVPRELFSAKAASFSTSIPMNLVKRQVFK